MRDPVIVMGMMRSGTTLLAEMVHKGGTPMFQVKDEINPAYDDGIKYERISAHAINLTLLGQTKNIAGIKIVGLTLHPMPSEALQKLHDEVGEQAWGFKDPRTTVTYPVWSEHFPRGPRLYIYRSHEEVARYYFRTARKPLTGIKRGRRAVRAWVYFNQQMLENIRSDRETARPHALVRYEELMRDKELIGALEKAAGVALFDARNWDLHRNKVSSRRDAQISRLLSLGFGKRLDALYRELGALRVTSSS